MVEQQAPPIADIAVTKTATPTVVTPGGNVTWTLVATNNGPDAADNALIVDNLPSSLTLVSFTSPAGWDCSATRDRQSRQAVVHEADDGRQRVGDVHVDHDGGRLGRRQTINNTAVVSTIDERDDDQQQPGF